MLKKDRKTLDFLEIEFAFLARLLRRDGRPSHNTMTTRKKTDNNNNKKKKKRKNQQNKNHTRIYRKVIKTISTLFGNHLPIMYSVISISKLSFGESLRVNPVNFLEHFIFSILFHSSSFFFSKWNEFVTRVIVAVIFILLPQLGIADDCEVKGGDPRRLGLRQDLLDPGQAAWRRRQR